MTGIDCTRAGLILVQNSTTKDSGKSAPKKGTLNGRSVSVSSEATLKVSPSECMEMQGKALEERDVSLSQPAEQAVSEEDATVQDANDVATSMDVEETEEEQAESVLGGQAQNDGRMLPEDFRRARLLAQDISAKYGDAIAWFIAQKIWDTPKYHRLSNSKVQRLERLARKLYSSNMKEKASFFESMNDEMESFYKEKGMNTGNGEIIFWGKDAIREEIYKDGPLTDRRKAAVSSKLTAILANTVKNPLADPKHRGEPPALNGVMAAGEISLEDPAQFLEALQRYASGLYSSPELGESKQVPGAKEALEALIWQTQDMQDAIKADSKKADNINWTPLLHSVDNLLLMESPVLTSHQLDTLRVIRVRVNEHALLPTCNEFKAELKTQLMGLERAGAEKKLHMGFSLGAAGSLGGVADALGGELRVTFDYMFTNNDYTIEERKRVAGGFKLYAGDRKILQISAGAEAAASTMRTYMTVDDLVNKHSNDLLAALLPLQLNNIVDTSLTGLKNIKKAKLVDEQQDLRASRAGDFELLSSRYYQQGVFNQKNTVAPVSLPPAPRFRRASSEEMIGELGAGIAENMLTGKLSGSYERLHMEQLAPLLGSLERQPELLHDAKKSFYLTAGESTRHGNTLDRSLDYKDRLGTIEAQLRSETDSTLRGGLLELRGIVQNEAAMFVKTYCKHRTYDIEYVYPRGKPVRQHA